MPTVDVFNACYVLNLSHCDILADTSENRTENWTRVLFSVIVWFRHSSNFLRILNNIIYINISCIYLFTNFIMTTTENSSENTMNNRSWNQTNKRHFSWHKHITSSRSCMGINKSDEFVTSTEFLHRRLKNK